jgi:hypothetical protein
MITLSCWVYPEGPYARTDLTAQRLRSMRPQLDGLQVRADALAAVFGWDEFAERAKRRQATIAAVTLDSCGANYSSPGGRPMMVLPFAPSRAAAFVGFYDWSEAPPADGSGSVADSRRPSD